MGKAQAKRLAAAAALICLLAAPAGAQVPDPYARQLARDLAQAERGMSELSFARAAGPFAGALSERTVQRFQVTLRAGQHYRIVGFCDDRCGGLSLRLTDAGDLLVRDNVMFGRGPMIDARPRMTGPHTIEVSMQRCAQAPCYFAFTIFSR
jgi:hypothetical protein